MDEYNVPIIISLGGSVLAPGGRGKKAAPVKINMKLIDEFCELIKEFDARLGIVVGGGATARAYIGETAKMTDDKRMLDLVGIQATRINAQVLISAMAKKGLLVNTIVPRTIEEAAQMFTTNKFVVMGGTEPGQTTDAVAVKLASTARSVKIINFSRVDAIYTEDPKKNKTAKKLQHITHNMLEDIIIKSAHEPGQSMVFDQLATTLATAHNLELHFVGNIKDFGGALKGKKHKGTVVVD